MGDRVAVGPPVHRDPATTTDARGNLAAIVLARHGIDPRGTLTEAIPAAVKAELRELAELLGLDYGPERRPGYCACGAKLTVTACSQQTGEYTHGRCLTCSRAARAAS